MTRCSIVHEDFTIVESHVKFELLLYSKNVTTFLKSKKVKVLDWPGNSPDLNPIKNLWMVVKNKVAEKQASSAKELKKAIKEVWVKKITPEYCRKLVESMPKRLNDVIKCKGGCTKY